MKINEILNNQDLILENNLSFDDLSSMHIAGIRAIAEDRFDIDAVSDKMRDVVWELQEFGIVDLAYGLTPMGRKAVGLIHSLGGSKDRRNAGRKLIPQDDIDVNVDDVYDDDYGGNFELDDDDSIFQPNRAGSINGYQ